MQQLRAPLQSRDYVVLLVAQILSEIGDWAARVALAVLVLDRTDSAAMTGLVVTFSVLPWIGIGQLLATLGDRMPRRSLMIVCDVIRAAAFLAMVIPMPIGVLLALTFVAGLPSPPFAASRAALLPETVPGNQYPDAIAVSQIAGQSTLVLGYLMGGVLVATIGARGALVVNSASFLLSALVLTRLSLGRTPTAVDGRVALRGGARAIWRDRMVRRAVGIYAFASGFAIIPESLVAVYALRHLETSDAGPGILAAAVPIGTILVSSVVPFHGSAGWLLRVAGIVASSGAAFALLFFSADAQLPVLLLGFVGVGVIFASALPTNTVFGSRVPNESRASAFGLAQGVLLFSEGAGAALGGVVASVWTVRTACIAAMAIVVLGGVACALWVPRESPVPTNGRDRRAPPAPPPAPLGLADVELERRPPAPPPRPVQTL